MSYIIEAFQQLNEFNYKDLPKRKTPFDFKAWLEQHPAVVQGDYSDLSRSRNAMLACLRLPNVEFPELIAKIGLENFTLGGMGFNYNIKITVKKVIIRESQFQIVDNFGVTYSAQLSENQEDQIDEIIDNFRKKDSALCRNAISKYNIGMYPTSEWFLKDNDDLSKQFRGSTISLRTDSICYKYVRVNWDAQLEGVFNTFVKKFRENCDKIMTDKVQQVVKRGIGAQKEKTKQRIAKAEREISLEQERKGKITQGIGFEARSEKRLAKINSELGSELEIGREVEFTNILPKEIERIDSKHEYHKDYEYIMHLRNGLTIYFNLEDMDYDFRVPIRKPDYRYITKITGTIASVRDVKKLKFQHYKDTQLYSKKNLGKIAKQYSNAPGKPVEYAIELENVTAEYDFNGKILNTSRQQNVAEKLNFIHRARYRIDIAYDEHTGRYYKVSPQQWEKLAQVADEYYANLENGNYQPREKNKHMAVTDGRLQDKSGVVYANAAMALKLNNDSPKRGDKLYANCEEGFSTLANQYWRYATREDIMNSTRLKVDSDMWNQLGFEDIDELETKDAVQVLDSTNESLEDSFDNGTENKFYYSDSNNRLIIDCSKI